MATENAAIRAAFERDYDIRLEPASGALPSDISGAAQTLDRWGNVVSVSDARDPSLVTRYIYN